MKLIRLWYILAAFLGIVTALIATSVKADDVYNFYFQKAPGPSTVYQGGGTGAPAGTPAVDGQNSTKVDVANTRDEKTFSRWAIFLGKNSFTSGISEFGDGSSGGSQANGEWMVGAQYNFSKNFGLGIQILQPSGQSIVFTGPMSTLDYAGEIIFTPFHMTVASLDVVDLGFVGGFTTLSTGSNGGGVPANNMPYSNDYSSEPTNSHAGSYFVGGLAALNVGKTFAIVGELDELPAQKASRFTFGVKFKL